MIDQTHIGHVFPSFSVRVEEGRLRFFAKAVGLIDPVYTDVQSARKAGHPNLPVPPTFLFCLEMDAPNPAATRDLLNINIANILHGEQHFSYYNQAYAEDTLTYEQRIADIYPKKNGALQFVVRQTQINNQKGTLIAELRNVTVVRTSVQENR